LPILDFKTFNLSYPKVMFRGMSPATPLKFLLPGRRLRWAWRAYCLVGWALG